VKTKLKIFTIIIGFFSLQIVGCDLLNVREGEKPDQPRGTFQYAVTYEDVITNLTNSIKEKNTQNYLACLADSSYSNVPFSFIPSAGSSSIYPALVDNWSRNNEEQYFKNMIIRTSQDQQLNLLVKEAQAVYQGDTVVYSAKYTFVVPVFASLETNIFQGELKFKIIRDSRFGWTIFNWQDIKNSESPTWSELKGQFNY
jgi:hypothetical protein